MGLLPPCLLEGVLRVGNTSLVITSTVSRVSWNGGIFNYAYNLREEKKLLKPSNHLCYVVHNISLNCRSPAGWALQPTTDFFTMDEQEALVPFPLSPGLYTGLGSTDLIFWGCIPTLASVCIPALKDPFSSSCPGLWASSWHCTQHVSLSFPSLSCVSSLLISNFFPT